MPRGRSGDAGYRSGSGSGREAELAASWRRAAGRRAARTPLCTTILGRLRGGGPRRRVRGSRTARVGIAHHGDRERQAWGRSHDSAATVSVRERAKDGAEVVAGEGDIGGFDRGSGLFQSITIPTVGFASAGVVDAIGAHRTRRRLDQGFAGGRFVGASCPARPSSMRFGRRSRVVRSLSRPAGIATIRPALAKTRQVVEQVHPRQVEILSQCRRRASSAGASRPGRRPQGGVVDCDRVRAPQKVVINVPSRSRIPPHAGHRRNRQRPNAPPLTRMKTPRAD